MSKQKKISEHNSKDTFNFTQNISFAYKSKIKFVANTSKIDCQIKTPIVILQKLKRIFMGFSFAHTTKLKSFANIFSYDCLIKMPTEVLQKFKRNSPTDPQSTPTDPQIELCLRKSTQNSYHVGFSTIKESDMIAILC